MVCQRLSHRIWLPFLFWVVLLASMYLVGCDRRRDDPALTRDMAVGWLESATESEIPIMQERAKGAWLKLKNGVCDPEPLVVYACLDFSKSDGPMLCLSCFDEDEDLLGWRVREESHDPNGAVTILEEHYPVYAGHPDTPLFSAFAYEIGIRSRDQKKDEQAWQTWVQGELGRLRTDTQEHPEEADALTSSAEKAGIKRPPVWISVPGPDKRVFLAIYDRAGHESEEFEIKAPSSWLAHALEEWSRAQP